MIRNDQLAGLLVILLLLPLGSTGAVKTVAETLSLNQVDQEFGKPNPKAPAELSHFAFLVGKWRCDAKLKSDKGEWQTFQAEWVGRYILDGYAIADEYRMRNSAGDLLVLGLNFRTYDARQQTWNIKWLDPWLELGWILGHRISAE